MPTATPILFPLAGKRPPSRPLGGTLRQAFTLLELLVVIGLVGVLAALALPVLTRVKSSARVAHCKSNTRQLMVALRIYVDEQNCYPRFGYLNAGLWSLWPDLLAPCLLAPVTGAATAGPRATPLECPSFPRATARQFPRSVTYGYSDEGYAFQGLGKKLVSTTAAWNGAAVHETEVVKPAETIGIGDGISRLKDGGLLASGISIERWRLSIPLPAAGDPPITAERLRAGDRFVRKLHSGRATVGFCDGHVEANRLAFLFEDTSTDALRRWNRDHEPHREWLK